MDKNCKNNMQFQRQANCETKKQFVKPDIQVLKCGCYDVLLSSAGETGTKDAFSIDLAEGFFVR